MRQEEAEEERHSEQEAGEGEGWEKGRGEGSQRRGRERRRVEAGRGESSHHRKLHTSKSKDQGTLPKSRQGDIDLHQERVDPKGTSCTGRSPARKGKKNEDRSKE